MAQKIVAQVNTNRIKLYMILPLTCICSLLNLDFKTKLVLIMTHSTYCMSSTYLFTNELLVHLLIIIVMLHVMLTINPLALVNHNITIDVF